jgi:hypothetical protein
VNRSLFFGPNVIKCLTQPLVANSAINELLRRRSLTDRLVMLRKLP